MNLVLNSLFFTFLDYFDNIFMQKKVKINGFNFKRIFNIHNSKF
jgi:hypothetical protein